MVHELIGLETNRVDLSHIPGVSHLLVFIKYRLAATSRITLAVLHNRVDMTSFLVCEACMPAA